MFRTRPRHTPGVGWAGRLARLQPWYLLTRAHGSGAQAGFTLVGGFLAIVILGTVAMVAACPLLFPSLGPTIFLTCSRPSTPESSPRNIMFGHTLGVFCGALALLVIVRHRANIARLKSRTENRVRWRKRDGEASAEGESR